MMFARQNVLGVGVSAINLDLAVNAIDQWIAKDEREYVCVMDVHAIMESRREWLMQLSQVISTFGGLGAVQEAAWRRRPPGRRATGATYGDWRRRRFPNPTVPDFSGVPIGATSR